MGEAVPVYLNVYDFTNMNSCLSVCGVGGYHTGIEIRDLEFCFCVVDTDPHVTGVIAIEPESAEYPFNRKIYLGDTALSGLQIESIIDELSLKYRCGAYHMFKLNCNHFSDQLSSRILNKRIPRQIFRSTNILTYMCCCLPTGLVSGRWALQAMQEQMRREEALAMELYGMDISRNGSWSSRNA